MSARLLIGCLIGCQLLIGAALAEPQLALVLDSSGSMADSDPRRQAVHLAKVLARTLDGEAGVRALVASGEDCRDGRRPVTTWQLQAGAVPTYERDLENGVRYQGANRFGAPIARARELLAPLAHKGTLLLLADAEGLSAGERRARVDAEMARRVAEAGGQHEDVDVRVTLMWNTKDDLDLHVTPPCGDKIFHAHRQSRCGGELDVDKNVGSTTRTPVENVRWPKDEAPAGSYRVMVRNYSFNEQDPRPIPFVVEVLSGTEVQRHEGVVSPNLESGSASDLQIAEFRFDPNRRAQRVDADEVEQAIGEQAVALSPPDSGCPDPGDQLRALDEAGVGLYSVAFGDAGSPFDGNRLMDQSFRVGDPAELASVAASVARRLGRTRIEHGAGRGELLIEVPQQTGMIWLLVTADADLSALAAASGNPGAESVDLDIAAGVTRGVDDGDGSWYRVIRLLEPQAGRWRFTLGNDALALGWLMERRTLLDARLASTPELRIGQDAALTLELIDPETGRPPDDPQRLRETQVQVRLGDAPIPLEDAGAGRYGLHIRPERGGELVLNVLLNGDGMERQLRIPLQVATARWRFTTELPASHPVDRPLLIKGRLSAIDDNAPPAPEMILADAGDQRLRLRDDGRDGDRMADDGVYSASWTPVHVGPVALAFSEQDGTPLRTADTQVDIIGWVRLRGPDRLELGTLESNGSGESALDLSASDIHGELVLSVGAELAAGGLRLEIEAAPGQWRPLSADTASTITLSPHQTQWSIRLIAARCPPRLDTEQAGLLRLHAGGTDASGHSLVVALMASTKPLPWLVCIWPYLLAGALTILALIIAWGIISPARFPRTLGIVLSPEEDLDEGFFQLIRARKGTGSGFYRDARACIGSDFRIGGRKAGALFCLIAGRPRPRIQCLGGQSILRRTAEDEWEPIGGAEQFVSMGTLYRNESATLFFTLRNA